ncbi:MAG TPA: type II secretion system protein [Gemmatimonadaceae bacterium]|nr:type II secretion system protein [Gemmatimonadaceae bacterium]
MTNRVRGESQRGARVPRRRSGFTLPELLITITLLGIIGTLLSTILMRQQRFHRAVASVADSRARMRDVATILPTDLRSISTAGRDILTMDVNSMQFRAFVGAAVLCKYGAVNIIEVPPRVLASRNVLTAWIAPPAPGDIAYLYNDSTTAGNADDSWTAFSITDTTSAVNPAWCPPTNVPPFTTLADAGARRYRLTLNANPNQAQIHIGAPIRFAREVRYSIYQAADNQYYVGYEKCVPNANPTLPGACSNREVLAGPVLPATTDTLTSGLFFVYYDKDGNRITDPLQAGSIARISVGIRTTSESLRQATASNTRFAGGDSLRFVVGIRNRI